VWEEAALEWGRQRRSGGHRRAGVGVAATLGWGRGGGGRAGVGEVAPEWGEAAPGWGRLSCRGGGGRHAGVGVDCRAEVAEVGVAATPRW
jgi:hypothetical protein